ncbi:aldo/keto reductase [Stenotrophomonas maltophilia]|uniref:aldo/keto reductase n=1 Tax=Stenotrophomonas maltophilia TaxID=40324 RepID=UPI0010AA850D|nr:aldo/keto reductase [Stenotrophomonas maltophilia]TIE15993.1 aldo/keto reductase [Stenotrophomonas maltophilia]TIE54703.1 aldo/keto reductase [Stenotrophomonas maltophilia]
MSLDHYRLLGRSGLRISPMALGTMTFGADWGWGADEAEARRIFDSYVDRGGNFVDTANNYTNGSAETLLGRFVQGQRDRLVIASKYTLATVPGDPNNAGNHRKSMLRSVEDSLRRLGTDYLDLLYLHAWDDTTGVDEVMHGFDDLVRSGKVLYAGISDTPAWQIARMQTLADLRGWSPLVALQIEYSLIQRSVEHELLPMADALGLGVVAWSPLGSGVLTGKYSTADLASADALQATPGGSRRSVALINGALTSRSLQIADEVQKIAADLSHSPAQVALAWLLRRPGADALPIIGARTLEQFEHNLIALDLELPTEALTRLDAISAVAPAFPHDFLQMPLPRMLLSGGTRLRPRAR